MPLVNINKHFEKCFAFIDSGIRAGGVLVHCLMGVSRSATIVIGYLIARGKFPTFESSFDHVRSCRSCVQPNFGFVRQLREFTENVKQKQGGAQGSSSSGKEANGAVALK